MIRRTIAALVVLAGVATAAMVASPGLRTRLFQEWAAVGGWTDQARQADPVGFARYAERKLKRDLETMQRTRRELAAEAGNIARKVREQEALACQAESMAEDFRGQFQLASTGRGFPIEVRGAAYTEDQTRAQVSMLLAESEGYRQSLAELRHVKQQAEAQIEALAVKISATEAQLAGLSAKRELLRARLLSAAGERLLAQVDELMAGNTRLLEGNPVRTVRELLETPNGKPSKPASPSQVEAFLSGTAAAQPITAAAATVTGDGPATRLTAKPPVALTGPTRRSKPIFEQR
ncbi:MAG: hypothetical protein ACC628_23245 [Pirellulaceae bacterium]